MSKPHLDLLTTTEVGSKSIFPILKNDTKIPELIQAGSNNITFVRTALTMTIGMKAEIHMRQIYT